MTSIKFRNHWIVAVLAIMSAGTASAEPVYTGTYADMYLKQNTFPVGLSEEKVFLDAAESTTITGHVGAQTDSRLVTFSSTTDVLDAANGFATIKSANDAYINNITITTPGYWFEGLIFSLKLAPKANDDLTITAKDRTGGADSFANWTTLDNWVNGQNRILVQSTPGNLLQSVTIDSIYGSEGVSGGLYQLKQTEIYGVTPVPEPETYAMLLAGLGLIGFAVRRKRH